MEKRSEMQLHTRRLVPMAFVADVPRSIGFYGVLGFDIANTFTPPEADAPVWAWLESGDARLMVSKAGDPVIPLSGSLDGGAPHSRGSCHGSQT
jgi:hypothetical protein